MTDRVRLRLPDRHWHRHRGQLRIDQCSPIPGDNSDRGIGSDNNLPRMITTGLNVRSRVFRGIKLILRLNCCICSAKNYSDVPIFSDLSMMTCESAEDVQGPFCLLHMMMKWWLMVDR